MSSARFTRAFALIALTLATLCSALPASAGQFNVKPIRVFLSKDATSTILTVENQAPTVLRLQIRPYGWHNDRHGQPVLTPTDDIVVFPTLVDVNPMERRSIRIGFTGTAAARELSYRIALDEMPSLESQIDPHRQAGLEVRTRITVPVFFSPLVQTQQADVSDISLLHGSVAAVFRNDGNIHATVSEAEIVGRDAGGSTVFDKHVNGWYVLPGEDWQFQATVPHACAKLKSVSITVLSDIGRFSKTADASALGCK